MEVTNISDFMSLDTSILRQIDWQYVMQPLIPYIVVIAVAVILRVIAGMFFAKIICRLALVIVIVINGWFINQNNAFELTKKRAVAAATEIINTTIQYLDENSVGL